MYERLRGIFIILLQISLGLLMAWMFIMGYHLLHTTGNHIYAILLLSILVGLIYSSWVPVEDENSIHSTRPPASRRFDLWTERVFQEEVQPTIKLTYHIGIVLSISWGLDISYGYALRLFDMIW